MLKVVVALVLVAHGIGHSIGLLQLFKLATVNPVWHGNSWLLAAAGTSATQVVAGTLWTIAIVGFTALAAALLGWLPSSWFPTLAIGSSVASLMGLVLFPVAFPLASTIGALGVDVAIVIGTMYLWLLTDSAA